MRTFLLSLLATALLAGISGCGGGSSSTSQSGGNGIAGAGPNVAAIVVDDGPAALAQMGSGYTNGAFVTVTVCNPSSTSSCNTIDHVLVDTGSIGLRLLSQSGDGELTLSLPEETDSLGNPLSECAEFAANVDYVSVRLANIQISSETASNVPIQVIGDMTSIPNSCAAIGQPVEDTLLSLGANGILGVGVFPDDCGTGCTTSITGNPEIYYSCPSTGCFDTVLTSESQEVPNPVTLFADNNGVIVELPAISASGQNNVSGSLVFGIGTQSNNSLSGVTVYPLDPDTGNFITILRGNTVTACNVTAINNATVCGFVDSGSNALYYTDPALTICADDSSFYCTNLTYSGSTVQNQGFTMSPTGSVDFSVESADTLFANSTCCTAYNDLAGPGTFWDWGLPFFFGRDVYSSIEGQAVSGQNNSYPFVAY